MTADKQPKDLQASNRNVGKGLKSLVLWNLNHGQQQSQLSQIGDRICCGCS